MSVKSNLLFIPSELDMLSGIALYIMRSIMKKNLVSTLIATACLVSASSAFAVTETFGTTSQTITTTVTSTSAVNIQSVPSSESVTVSEVARPGTKLASLDITATGLNAAGGTNGHANIKVAVDSSNYDSRSQTWLFKNDSGRPLFALPYTQSNGWSFNGPDATSRTDGRTEATLKLDFVTKEGNKGISPGVYHLPVTISYNTF